MLPLDGITLKSALTEVQSVAQAAPIFLPQIGARSKLTDVLRLLGHEPTEQTANFEHTFTNRRVHRGQTLLVAGQPCENLYIALSGSFKTTLHEEDGTQQIVAFPMRGDLIGLGSIQGGRYPVSVTALEEAHAAVIPYHELIELTLKWPVLEEAFMEAVSAELLRNYRALRAMGALGAEARLACFLHELGQRMARFGFSAREFRLTMTRADIGSYLGLSIETVSRAFTSLVARGVLDANRRSIRILDRDRLGHSEEFEPHSLQYQIQAHGQMRAPRPAAPAHRPGATTHDAVN